MIENKHVLTEDQIIVLKSVHNMTVEGGLIKLGIPPEEQPRFIEASNKTFDFILKEAQVQLRQKGERDAMITEMQTN